MPLRTITIPCPHPFLQTELQHLANGAVTPRRRVAETDPLLLDQVYSCTSPRQQQQQSSPLDTPNSSSPTTKGATLPQAATQQSGNSFTRCGCVYVCVCACWACPCQHSVGDQCSPLSCCRAVLCVCSGATSLNSLAALAAYRRQICLGLDPSTAASRPVSAAAASAQASAGSRRSFALKSRPNGEQQHDSCRQQQPHRMHHRPAHTPAHHFTTCEPCEPAAQSNRTHTAPPLKLRVGCTHMLSNTHDTLVHTMCHAGMTSPDFGSGHVPGLLPRPDVQDTAAPCTPAQSGMGPLVPPRLFQRSSCPPLCAEPLKTTPDDGPGIVAACQADRELLGCGAQQLQLINRLVYDSLQPAVPPGVAGPAAAATDCPTAGMGSSCCGASTVSDSAGSGSSSQAAAGSPDVQAACEYVPGLSPWYTLQGPGDSTLMFESRFESGNLRRAIQVRLSGQQTGARLL